MTVRYEANPPKTGSRGSVDGFVDRLERIAGVCDGIHVTEDVLGVPRMSPVETGRLLRGRVPGCTMTLSMRVRDKSGARIDRFVADAVDAGFRGLLAVAGDRAPGSADSGQIPSRVVSRLRRNGVDKKLDVYLSVPAGPGYGAMDSKIRARPRGFMTQVVHTVRQVEDIVAFLPGFDIIPIALFPSPRNKKAAEFLRIDMSGYGDFSEFVGRVHGITGDILITSPGDHEGLYGFLSQNTL